MLKNKFYLFLPLYLLPILLISLSFSSVIRHLPDSSQPITEKEVWIYANHSISQTITPKNNGLDIISLYMRNVALRNQEPIAFDLYDSAGKLLRHIDINGYNVVDGSSLKFQFPALSDSAGKTYKFSLSSPSTQWYNAVGVGFAAGEPYLGGETIVDGTKGDLSFQLFYAPGNRLALILDSGTTLITQLLRPEFLLYFITFSLITYYSIRLFYQPWIKNG